MKAPDYIYAFGWIVVAALLAIDFFWGKER